MNLTVRRISCIAFLTFAVGCGQSAEDASKEVRTKKAYSSVEAAELSRAYQNPKKGNEQYRGKILRVTGRVGFLGEEKRTVNGKERITKVLDFQIAVETPPDRAPENATEINDAVQKGFEEGMQHIRLGVRCTFPPDQETALAVLERGDQVTVKGKCVGKTLLGMGPVGLEGCVILQKEFT